MRETPARPLHDFLHAERPRQERFLAELVRMPSDNPPGDCAPHAERAAALLEGLGRVGVPTRPPTIEEEAALMSDYPRDMTGYGRRPPDPAWPGRARLCVQFVVNYEEGGENNVLHGDPHSEAFLSEIIGAANCPTGSRGRRGRTWSSPTRWTPTTCASPRRRASTRANSSSLT